MNRTKQRIVCVSNIHLSPIKCCFTIGFLCIVWSLNSVLQWNASLSIRGQQKLWQCHCMALKVKTRSETGSSFTPYIQDLTFFLLSHLIGWELSEVGAKDLIPPVVMTTSLVNIKWHYPGSAWWTSRRLYICNYTVSRIFVGVQWSYMGVISGCHLGATSILPHCNHSLQNRGHSTHVLWRARLEPKTTRWERKWISVEISDLLPTEVTWVGHISMGRSNFSSWRKLLFTHRSHCPALGISKNLLIFYFRPDPELDTGALKWRGREVVSDHLVKLTESNARHKSLIHIHM